jgi:autotransporter-associated beta strand protein
VGITNDSGIAQSFAFVSDDFFSGTIVFSNNATAGTNVTYFVPPGNFGGQMIFKNNSTAESATIDISFGAFLTFANNSTPGSADIFATSNSIVQFLDNATAGNSSISTDFASVSFANNSTAGSASIGISFGAFLTFANNSTAANSNISTFENDSVEFLDNSTAGSAGIFLRGFSGLGFGDRSTAGSATILAVGGHIFFGDSSRGGTAQINLFSSEFGSGSFLDISGHNAPGVTIGSLEGDETARVGLGANNLTIGSNNLSTTFFGEIGGTGGSLTKIGSGTFILSGANTYTGNTNVNRGVLQVDGSITSDTFVNPRGTLAGTGSINGNVTNNGTVSPGSAGAPGLLTVVGHYTQTQFATLMIQIAGTSTGDFSVLNVLGSANLNGFLDPVLWNGFVPTIGDSFTFLNYASLTGEFSDIRHRFFDNGMLQWSVTYEANHAILTVEQHTIPDRGSTFVLLVLGLLGLVMYRRQLLRGQPLSGCARELGNHR